MNVTPPLVLSALVMLASCSHPEGYAYDGSVPYDGTNPAAQSASTAFAPGRFYPPPGPASDPWGPYVREAASRFRIPEQWIRAVMRQESGGREQAVSPVGAMGLMQVMPTTYAGLRSRHHLGMDPFNPHNNILAGAGYIREMYDRYGAPGFLAAYNAGPDRLDKYLAGVTSLPDETVNYLAAITPNLGGAVPMSGPLAEYASVGQGIPIPSLVPAPSVASLASGCDVNAAFNPDQPCAPLERAAYTSAPVMAPTQLALGGSTGCDADAAFDPDRPCNPTASVQTAAPAAPAWRRSAFLGSMPGAAGQWGVQVGAFVSPGLARAVAEGAKAEVPDQLGAAAISTPSVSSPGGPVLFRARLTSLSAAAATSACDQLNRRQLPCVTVQPNG